MGVAAVLFTTLAEVLDARQFIIPGVGVREGVLHELAAAHFGPASAHDERAEALRQQARRFAARMHSDAGHCEHVRRLAAQLFDQLAPVHELPSAQRVTLELGALLHDVGVAVNARGHHKHGEYLVRHADIPGLMASPCPIFITVSIARSRKRTARAFGSWPRCCASRWRWTQGKRRSSAVWTLRFSAERFSSVFPRLPKPRSTFVSCAGKQDSSNRSSAFPCDLLGFEGFKMETPRGGTA
jgi:exopolyphosphatase/pppGpp-phosphohydrolase